MSPIYRPTSDPLLEDWCEFRNQTPKTERKSKLCKVSTCDEIAVAGGYCTQHQTVKSNSARGEAEKPEPGFNCEPTAGWKP